MKNKRLKRTISKLVKIAKVKPPVRKKPKPKR
jgi:hypothetical protein